MRYLRLFSLITWLTVGLIASTGVSLDAHAQDTGTVDVVGDAETGNPSDEPGVIDNPITEFPIDINGQIALWLVVLGFFASPVASFVNRYFADPLQRGVVAFLVSLALALLDTVIRGVLNPTNLVASLLFIFVAAIGFYKLYFQPTGLDARLSGKAVVR